MQRAAAQMDTLINDLLKYATVGQQKLRQEPVALDAVVRATQALLENEIRSRNAIAGRNRANVTPLRRSIPRIE